MKSNQMVSKITRDTRKVNLEQYVSFTEYLADYLIGFPQVVSVYQMGGWTQPGISDIDLIVIVKQLVDSDVISLNLMNKALARNLDEAYMLMHAPFVISEKGFQDLDLFFYCSDLKKLRGKDITINKNPDDLQEIAELYKLVSVLAHTYPRFFSGQKTMSLRSFLTFGYSLKHTYRIIKDFDNTFSNAQIEHYVQEMTKLRKKVIETSEVKDGEITPLIELGMKVSRIMLRKVDEIIKSRITFSPSKEDFLYVKNYETVFSFVKNSSSFKMENKNGINFLELPHSFAVFILLSKNEGILHKIQSRNTYGNNSIEVAENQLKLLNRIEAPFSEYHLVFNNCKTFNGMSFELNTPFAWDSRKYRAFHLLDNARRVKHFLSSKKKQKKLSQLINDYNS